MQEASPVEMSNGSAYGWPSQELAIGSARGQPSDDPAIALLQRRLATESSERDSSKASLVQVARSVDFFRQRMQALASRPSAGQSADNTLMQRGRELLKDLDQELEGPSAESPRSNGKSPKSPQGSPMKGGTPSKAGSYEVLRQALEDTARRSESLNVDLVHQAEANDELLQTLHTVKDANRRLLNQVSSQTEEITTLTSQRVADEERMDVMARRREDEREMHRLDTQGHVLGMRDDVENSQGHIHEGLREQLQGIASMGGRVHEEVLGLRAEMQARQRDIEAMQEDFQNWLADLEEDLVARCQGHTENHGHAKGNVQRSIDDHNTALEGDREERKKDDIGWKLEHEGVALDRDMVAAQHTREIAQLHARHEVSAGNLALEQQLQQEDRASLERRINEAEQEADDKHAETERAEQHIVELESALAATRSENLGTERTIADLRKDARETNDALAAAVSGNEHLRSQLDEQQRRFQEKHEADLVECRGSCEQKVANARRAHERDTDAASKQLEALTQDAQVKDEEIDRVGDKFDAARDESDRHDEELNARIAQHHETSGDREALEKDLSEIKHHFVRERITLQAARQKLLDHHGKIGKEHRQLTGELQDAKRQTAARELESDTFNAHHTSLLSDHQATLDDHKKRLQEVDDQHDKFADEMAAVHDKVIETHAALETSYGDKVKELESERQRMAAVLTAELENTQQGRDTYEHERDKALGSLRSAHDESRSKLEGVERDRSRVEEQCRLEIVQATQAVTQLQRKADGLDSDVGRLRALLAESEANLATVRQESNRLIRESSLQVRHCEDEVRAQSGSLEIARREEASLNRLIDAQAKLPPMPRNQT